MCDHVCGMPKGSGLGVAIGMSGVTWRSARSLDVMVAVSGKMRVSVLAELYQERVVRVCISHGFNSGNLLLHMSAIFPTWSGPEERLGKPCSAVDCSLP